MWGQYQSTEMGNRLSQTMTTLTCVSKVSFLFSLESSLSADALWERVRNIEEWPERTASISSAEIIGNGTLATGSEIVMKQPGAPESKWVVTEYTAHHVVEAELPTGSSLTLIFAMQGRFAKVWGVLMGRKIRKFLELEAEGLTKTS
jgi:hypothetical protein